MPIEVTCPACHRQFKAPDNAAGKRARCPQCNGVIEIPAPTPVHEDEELELEQPLPTGPIALQSEIGGASPADGQRKPCPMCGEMIQRDAIKCRFCGEIFDEVLAKAERSRGGAPKFGESVEEAARRLIKEKQDRATAIQIFVLSLFGCFSPILAIYGIVFLVRRPYAFKYKGLAIAGTIIHCIWTLFLIASLTLSANQ